MMRKSLLQTTTTTKQARLGKAANKQKIDKTRTEPQMQQKKRGDKKNRNEISSIRNYEMKQIPEYELPYQKG